MKERLTGAAVLVILGVILIPLLLDGPDPDAPSGRVAEPGRQIIEIKRGADQPAGPGTAIQAVTGVESEPEPAPPSAARTATPADRTAPAAASGPGATPAQDAEPTARGPGPPTAAAVTGKPAAPAPKAAAQPAPKPTPPTAGPAAVPSAGGGWAIQIGSFGSRENADRLKRELDGEGYPVFLMPVRSGGRTLHRVRVGPYSDRATADEVARRLAAAGPGGTVVRHGG